MTIPHHVPVRDSYNKNPDRPYKTECECGSYFYAYENHAIDVRVRELMDYMEENGYDPIGASDVRYDAAQWLYPRVTLWPEEAPELYRRFTLTARFKEYGIEP